MQSSLPCLIRCVWRSEDDPKRQNVFKIDVSRVHTVCICSYVMYKDACMCVCTHVCMCQVCVHLLEEEQEEDTWHMCVCAECVCIYCLYSYLVIC